MSLEVIEPLRSSSETSAESNSGSAAQRPRASALTHSDGSGISESFLKIDAADADHWKGFDVLLCALM